MGSETWNDGPSVNDGAGWKPADSAVGDGWQADGGGADDGWTGEISEQNTSKHAHGDGFDAPHDGGCRNCGADGHFVRDCPEPRQGGGGGLTGECYNCGEIGRNKSDCPNPRVERAFTGVCNLCGQEGHRRAECPEKPPEKCKICGDEGHKKDACTANRLLMKMEGLKLTDATPESAWLAVVAADKEKEVEDIRKAIISYIMTCPGVTFVDLEATFRDDKMNTYLIAKQQEVSDTHTIVNLQGQIDQKFAVSIQFTEKPRRAKFAEGWPTSTEDNLVRLAEGGFIMDRMVQKCTNCRQLGHGSKACPEEKEEPANKTVITCANCNEEGHYARDCKQARKSNKKGCRNCGSEEHIAKECDQPRSAENVECKNCGEMGHFSKDCPSREPDLCRNCGQEGHRKADCTNERVMQCRNCDEWGHASRECPKPRDYSRVECRNCGEKGHTVVRCKNPPKESEDGEDDGAGGAGGGDWDNGGGAAVNGSGSGGWEDGAATNRDTGASGGW